MPSRNANCFIPKMIAIMQEHPTLVHWSNNGLEITINNLIFYKAEVHPLYFPKCNYSSFLRQLSMYGFKKTTTKTNQINLRHEEFRKGNQNAFGKIQRKRHRKDMVKDESQSHSVQLTPSFEMLPQSTTALLAPPILPPQIEQTIAQLKHQLGSQKAKSILFYLAHQIQSKLEDTAKEVKKEPVVKASFVSFGRLPSFVESRYDCYGNAPVSLQFICEAMDELQPHIYHQ